MLTGLRITFNTIDLWKMQNLMTLYIFYFCQGFLNLSDHLPCFQSLWLWLFCAGKFLDVCFLEWLIAIDSLYPSLVVTFSRSLSWPLRAWPRIILWDLYHSSHIARLNTSLCMNVYPNRAHIPESFYMLSFELRI